jgi:NO-binding membrane sensor protein with MHYT domain
MEILYEAIVVLHFIGLAALLGGFLVQVSAPTRVVNRAMLDGAITQLVTGLALVGLAETVLSDTEDVNHMKVGIKLLILLVITGLAFANRKKASLATGPYLAIGLLTIANIVIAVFV